ncbi:MAG: hypothetical protein J6Z31_04190 [Fibrobacter sp.]|nr:hypothetical protein [Fibrobacter sp.]
MNSDTLNTAVDSAAVEPVQIGISVHADPLPSTIFLGDTFEYRVNVTWQASAGQGALLVVPTGSASAKGITQIGLREEHSQVVQNGNTVSNTQFVYKLVADDSGNVSIPALHFQIPSADGPFQFQSESVAFRIEKPSNAPVFVICGVFALALCAFACVMLLRKKKRAEALQRTEKAEDKALADEFLLLKKRIAKAESRAWLLELEKICKSWAKKRYGSENLEELLKNGTLEGWDSLVDEFAHARYGGGDRDAFQNKETWKLAAKLLNIEDEE